jgi:class 3 adenylate cyclase/tetratricopeptide (TPR) repeat protein
MACGTPLGRRCPACGTATPAEARFCMACGTALEVAPTPATAPAPAAEERRLVSVLFADVSGYTGLAESLDHETVKALMDRCLNRLAREVDQFGGRVDKFIGDNVMAVFGAPTAHEDDALRAVRAAIAMQEAMTEINQDLSAQFGVELGLRVGINTGEVLAGRVGDSYTVVGDVVNVAARLQSASPVGGVLVGERTYTSTANSVSYRELEPLSLKGKAQPVSAWEATGLKAVEPRRENPALDTPFVGRADELGQLERSFSRAIREGAPHIVTIAGHAGVGKTRLLHEFEQSLQAATPAVGVRHGRCLAFGSTGVYWPLSEMVRGECGILHEDPADVAWTKLLGCLGPPISALEGPEEAKRRLAALARLLGAEPPDELAAGEQDEQAAREGFFGAVRTVFEALAGEGPVVLAWEDIHWADDGTLDLIEYLSQWLRAPVLQICLAREDLLQRRPAWSNPRRSATVMFLDALAPGETQQLIESLLQQTAASTDIVDSLAERSGGNPLFAETIARRIVEQGDVHEAELPDTVQGLLAARIDSLEPSERDLVTHASVLGRTFWESALEPVADRAGVQLESVLRSLRAKDIIVLGERTAQGEERELAFKHVLIRDVAYGMLPKAVRARKHAEVGAFIEQRAGQREGIAALLAEHYTLAAGLATEARFDASEIAPLKAKAGRFAESAGDTSAALFSNADALSYYQAAEEYSGDDAAVRARIAEKRGDIAVRLGRVDTAIECWNPCLAYWETQDDLEHVAELHRKVGVALAHKGERSRAIEQLQQGINLIKERPPSLPLMRLYEEAAWLYMQAGENMLAIYASEKALRLAEQLGAVAAASRTHGIFGRIFGRIGDIGRARQNLERAVELARESGQAEAALALLTLGQHLEQFEGDCEAAQVRYSEGLALAEQIGDVPAQIELQAALAQLAFYRCEWDEVRRASDQSAQLAEREGLVGKLCLPNTLRGLLSWRKGELDGAVRLFKDAHQLAERTGWSEVSFSALLGLATARRDQGELKSARESLDRALAVGERAGLTTQSILARAALTLVCTMDEDPAAAQEAADQAATLAAQARNPVGEAAALEARGIVEETPVAFDTLRQAAEAWDGLGRRLEATRCRQLLGRRLSGIDLVSAAETLAQAASTYEELGIRHLAEQARVLAEV